MRPDNDDCVIVNDEIETLNAWDMIVRYLNNYSVLKANVSSHVIHACRYCTIKSVNYNKTYVSSYKDKNKRNTKLTFER